MRTTSSGTAVKSANVTLSAAKGLARRTERCFAEFTLSEANGLSRKARIPLKFAHGASLISKCLPSPVLALDKFLPLAHTYNRQELVR
jgi:hypothetical protein